MMMASVSSYFLERRYDQRPMFAVVLMLIAWCTLTVGSAMSGLGRLFSIFTGLGTLLQWIHRTGALCLHPTTDPSRTTCQFKVAVARFVRNHLQHPFADHSKRAHLRHRSHCPQSALLAPFTQPVYGCSKCTTVDICIDQHVSHHQSLLDPKSTRPSTKSVLATGDVLDLRGHRDSDQCSTEFQVLLTQVEPALVTLPIAAVVPSVYVLWGKNFRRPNLEMSRFETHAWTVWEEWPADSPTTSTTCWPRSSVMRRELQSKSSPESPVGGHLNQIIENSQRAADLLNRMMTYSGRIDPQRDAIHPKGPIESAFRSLAPLQPPACQMKLELKEGLPNIRIRGQRTIHSH